MFLQIRTRLIRRPAHIPAKFSLGLKHRFHFLPESLPDDPTSHNTPSTLHWLLYFSMISLAVILRFGEIDGFPTRAASESKFLIGAFLEGLPLFLVEAIIPTLWNLLTFNHTNRKTIN